MARAPRETQRENSAKREYEIMTRPYPTLLDYDLHELRVAGIPSETVARDCGDDSGRRLSAWIHDHDGRRQFTRQCAYLHHIALRGKTRVIEGILADTPYVIAPRITDEPEDRQRSFQSLLIELQSRLAEMSASVDAALSNDGRIDANELETIERRGHRLLSGTYGVLEAARKDAIND